MLTALIALYSLGFGMFFIMHQVFDGGIIYSTRKEGPIIGLLMAAIWPLFVAALLVVALVSIIRRGN
jgi:hypothetical protein